MNNLYGLLGKFNLIMLKMSTTLYRAFSTNMVLKKYKYKIVIQFNMILEKKKEVSYRAQSTNKDFTEIKSLPYDH